jgi:hypothetical protein
MVATLMSLWWVFLLCFIGCIIGMVKFFPAFKVFGIFGAKDERQFEAAVGRTFDNFGRNAIVGWLCSIGAIISGLLFIISVAVNIIDYFVKK